jgi:hypothetical protein
MAYKLLSFFFWWVFRKYSLNGILFLQSTLYLTFGNKVLAFCLCLWEFFSRSFSWFSVLVQRLLSRCWITTTGLLCWEIVHIGIEYPFNICCVCVLQRHRPTLTPNTYSRYNSNLGIRQSNSTNYSKCSNTSRDLRLDLAGILNLTFQRRRRKKQTAFEIFSWFSKIIRIEATRDGDG